MSLEDAQTASLMNPPKRGRDSGARDEEKRGVIKFVIVFNDGDPQRLNYLVQLKSLFSAQLPNMPRTYILRLVFDRNHRALALVKHGRVVGGITFRPFHSQKFAEVVFCAIASDQQVKGYGTRIMNVLKEHVKTEGIEYFLTYADNHAIGYFKKQGFDKNIAMHKDRYVGFIKHYNDSTLMCCKLIFEVNFKHLSDIVARQRMCVMEQMKKASKSHVRHRGLKFERDADGKVVPIDICSVEGVTDAGYVPPTSSSDLITPDAVSDMQARMGSVLKYIKKQREGWAFLEAVDPLQVIDYYQIITKPMDLRTMTNNLNDGLYTTVQAFINDFELIVNNCRAYNLPHTDYYANGNAQTQPSNI
jgi:histone acetyltransferase